MDNVLFEENDLSVTRYSFFVLYSKDLNKSVLSDDAWDITYKEAIRKYPVLKDFGIERYDECLTEDNNLNYLYGFYYYQELHCMDEPEHWFLKKFPELAALEWGYDILY